MEAEIIVVDNASTDDTHAIVEAWSSACTVPVKYLSEPKPNLPRAQNRALRVAKGELIAFTDDDCRMSESYVVDLLRHDANDTGLVLRGGRIELGDKADLPLTITLPLLLPAGAVNKTRRGTNVSMVVSTDAT